MTPAVPSTRRSRGLALAVLCAGQLMIILDGTIVNVALPAIQRELGFSQSSLAWVVNAYLIAFGGLLLLAGRLGDLLGRKRILLAGLTVFTAASLVCGVSVSQHMLVAARFVQGVGGAMASAVVLGMIVLMYPQPRAQAKAIGVYSFVAAAGASIGLLAGGLLTQAVSWHWIFFVNVPIGFAAVLLVRRLLGSTGGIGLGKGADVAGALLVTSALMLAVYTIVEAADHAGSRHTRSASAPSPSSCWWLSSYARRAQAIHSCRCGCSTRASSRAPTSSRHCWWPACSACSSSASCTCSACSATTRCGPAWPSSPYQGVSVRSRSASPHA